VPIFSDNLKLGATVIKSYTVAIRVKREPMKYVTNGLRFDTHGNAVIYAADLRTRWRDVVGWTIAISSDPPNCTYPVPNDRYQVQREDIQHAEHTLNSQGD
jgi:hypothetical protein